MDNAPGTTSRYYWAPEWHPHEATWIAWPHNPDTWPGAFEGVPATFERVIRTLAEVETVHVLGGPPNAFAQAESMLHGCPNVHIHRVTTNDCWIRDYGPTFVFDCVEQSLVGIDWVFNAWGNKYHPHDSDTAAARRICSILHCLRLPSTLVAEGGGIETDGEGTLLTTRSCLMAASRNPFWSEMRVEEELKTKLGVEKILWIDGGSLAGDDTDSHIDQLVRFVRPGLVVAAVANSIDDSNHLPLNRQLECLQQVTDARGRQFDIVELPIPPPRFVQGKRVPESYCNFYIANEIVLVPQFRNSVTDEGAVKILGELFSTRKIVPIDSRSLVWGLGSFHCSTQQQPKLDFLGVPVVTRERPAPLEP